MKYIINGERRLSGEVRVSGNKNSIFPCIAAALLTDEEVILENVANLKDTEVLIQIIKKLGVKIEKKQSNLVIRASSLRHFSLSKEFMVKLRGSIVLAGAMLSRMGRVNFYFPGGDIIGRRSIETHLEGFKRMGVSIKRNNLKFSLNFSKEQANQNLEIFLQEASVTATENLILASVIGQRETILRNCAKEPHVVDLCRMLLQMGAIIEGVGGDTLKITGVEKLRGTKFTLSADYIEIGTYIVAAAITNGEVKISGINGVDLDPLLTIFKAFGIKIEKNHDSLKVSPSKLKTIPKVVTNIWPGFPTDLISVVIVLATQSKGVILCHDWMYESRMFFTDKLITMGARITLADPHRCLVYGPTRLRGRVLDTPDIRAGMALVLAALTAKGKSIINQSELIERGYDSVVEKLRKLGADITRASVD